MAKGRGDNKRPLNTVTAVSCGTSSQAGAMKLENCVCLDLAQKRAAIRHCARLTRILSSLAMTIAGYGYGHNDDDGFHIPAQHLTKLTGRVVESSSRCLPYSQSRAILFPPDHLDQAEEPARGHFPSSHTHTQLSPSLFLSLCVCSADYWIPQSTLHAILDSPGSTRLSPVPFCFFSFL